MPEKGQAEIQPRDNFFQRLIRRSSEKSILSQGNEKSRLTDDFERELLRNGTLRFDFDEYVREAEADLKGIKDWYDQNPHWDAKRTAESMARDFERANQNLVWRRRFSGQIPKHWHIWYNVMDDFESAREKGIRLSSTLIDAAISHPHHMVANEVGKGQRLNIKQIAWLFVRPDFSERNRNEIIQSQREMGVSAEEIKEAIRVADEVREEVRKRKAGVYSLRDTSQSRRLPGKPSK